MYLLQSSGGLVNVSVLGIVLIISSLFFYGIGILLFYLVLSMGLCLAQEELPLHLDFAILFDHFYFNAAFWCTDCFTMYDTHSVHGRQFYD